MRVLIVEKERSLTKVLLKNFNKRNYLVDVATDGETGWSLASTFTYDVILLNPVLPKFDGIRLCQRLRAEGNSTPILILTDLDDVTHKVKSLDAGADGYVVEPYGMHEVAARIRALLRRGNVTLPLVRVWGQLRLDPASLEVRYEDQSLELTATEYRLLKLFLDNHSRVFNRYEILERLYALETHAPQEQTVRAHLKRLRQKLRSAGAPDDLIETVYGMGYRLKPQS